MLFLHFPIYLVFVKGKEILILGEIAVFCQIQIVVVKSCIKKNNVLEIKRKIK